MCSVMWADNFWIVTHSKGNLHPNLWRISTHDGEEKVDMIMGTTVGCHKFLFEEKFKILSCAVNRQGKTIEAIEERLQSATKAFWKDNLIY